jgi:hypothetical protein
MKSLLTFACATILAVSAQAGELDNPNQNNVSSVESTIVIRVNNQTGAVEKLELSDALKQHQAEELAQDAAAPFEKIDASKVKGELDQEAGASSWYWYCPTYYSTPSYGYGNYYNTGFYNYGYWYSNYYSYNYGNYSYNYYQPYYGYSYGNNNCWNNYNSCGNGYRRGYRYGGWR